MAQSLIVHCGFDKLPVWTADKRLLPSHLRVGGDNGLKLRHLRLALRAALETRLTKTQREYLRLFYCDNKNKSEIAKLCGAGSSAVCKTMKSAEKEIREYVELYMTVCERVRRDLSREDDEYGEVRGEIRANARN